MICTSSALGLEAMAAKVAATALYSAAATFRGATVLGLCRLNDSLKCLPPRRILPVCRISRQAPSRAFFCVPLRANSSAAEVAEKAKNSEIEDDFDEEDYDEEEEEEEKFRIRNESSSHDEQELEEDEDEEFQSENESVNEDNEADTDSESETQMKMPVKSKFPLLTPKEKKELLAVVHSLGNEMKPQQVGKWGVTPNSLHLLNAVLDKRELVKVRVLPNCPADVDQVAYDLIDGLEAQLVNKIGHTIVLYRPSVKKAEKEEKRKADKAKWERRQKLSRRPRRT